MPSLIISIFLLLALGMHAIDIGTRGNGGPLRDFLGQHMYASPAATRQFLSVIAGGIITTISITFSALLLGCSNPRR